MENKEYSILLANGTSITELNLSTEVLSNICNAVSKDISITIDLSGKYIMINPRHIVLVKEQ